MLGEAHLARKHVLGAFLVAAAQAAPPPLCAPSAVRGSAALRGKRRASLQLATLVLLLLRWTFVMLGQAHLEMDRRATWSPFGTWLVGMGTLGFLPSESTVMSALVKLCPVSAVSCERESQFRRHPRGSSGRLPMSMRVLLAATLLAPLAGLRLGLPTFMLVLLAATTLAAAR